MVDDWRSSRPKLLVMTLGNNIKYGVFILGSLLEGAGLWVAQGGLGGD